MRKLLAIAVVWMTVLIGSTTEASVWTFNVVLNGASERPTPVVTPAIGSAVVIFDDVTGAIDVNGIFAGLTSPAAAAHIHGFHDTPFNPLTPGPGQDTGVMLGLTAFPAVAGTVTGSGNLNTLADADPVSPVTTFADKRDRLLGGFSYINIHTVQFPGGEIRGQLVNPIPEPATLILAGLGFLGVAFAARRRRKSVA
jgi:hypothetical protein